LTLRQQVRLRRTNRHHRKGCWNFLTVSGTRLCLNQERGKLFETFAAMLFGEVFKVAHTNYLTDRGEIDLILELEPGGLYWAHFGNEALVECKNLRKKATYDQTATFITKVAQSRRRLGFIVSYLGFTQDALQAIHDNAADRNAPLVVAITGEDIRKSLQLSEAPEAFFKNAYRNVTIPRRGRRSAGLRRGAEPIRPANHRRHSA